MHFSGPLLAASMLLSARTHALPSGPDIFTDQGPSDETLPSGALDSPLSERADPFPGDLIYTRNGMCAAPGVVPEHPMDDTGCRCVGVKNYGILAYWGNKRGVCFYHDDHCKDPAAGMWATEEGSNCLTGKTAKGPWRSVRLVDSTTACKMVGYTE